MKMINPTMPEPYCYEKDFRKIPREYLNPRIPQGRQMIKWQPFATMPEQYEIIRNHIEQQNKVDKPILDDMQLSDLNNVLIEKLFYNPFATIIFWENGYYKELECEINKVDSMRYALEVVKDDEKVKIKMNCVVNIK